MCLYLSYVFPLLVNQATAEKYCLNMTYFFGLFSLPATFSQEGFMASLFSSGVGEELMAAPIMSAELKHTRSLGSAMHHYLNVLFMQMYAEHMFRTCC